MIAKFSTLSIYEYLGPSNDYTEDAPKCCGLSYGP